MCLPKSKQPKSKSFEAVKDAIDDVLYPAKLSFVSYFAGLIQPFLTCYQREKPMITFLHDDIFNLVFSLLQFVVKPNKLQECETMSDLKKIDLGKKENLLNACDFNTGFLSTQFIKELKQKDKVSSHEDLSYKRNVYEFVVSTVEKMFDRIPVESTIIWNAIVFNPAKMIATQTDELHKKATSILTKFINLNLLTPTVCDQILKEYKVFLRNDIVFSCGKFSNYDKQKDRLDTFFFSLPAIKKYVNLAFVIKMILTLSHGQAGVERSFSINKSVVDVNMKAESIVARKTIKDHMLSNDIQPDMIGISNKMINFYRSARQKYEIHKVREAEKKKKKDKSIQQQILEEEIKDTTEKSNQLLETEKMLDK